MKLELGSEVLELLAGADSNTWTYTLGGGTGTVDARQVEPGTYSILLNGHSYEVRTGKAAEGRTWVEVAGRRQEIELHDPRSNRGTKASGQRAGQATLKAPMPGKVVRLLVSEGDTVEAGQGLAVVEAMKMQNEMKAPRAGVVKSIKTFEGASVGAGEALLVIE